MPKIVRKKLAKKAVKKKAGRAKAELIYLRFRLKNHCRCGGTTEVAIQPGRDGYAECVACATHVRVSHSAAVKLLESYL